MSQNTTMLQGLGGKHDEKLVKMMQGIKQAQAKEELTDKESREIADNNALSQVMTPERIARKIATATQNGDKFIKFKLSGRETDQPISRNVLRNLNRDLRSSSVLNRASRVYETTFSNASACVAVGAGVLSGMSGFVFVMDKTFDLGLSVALSLPLTFIGAGVAGMVGAGIAGVGFSSIFDRSVDNNKIKVSFEDQNPSFLKQAMKIPGKAITGLSVGAIWAKDQVKALFGITPEKAQEVSRDFADNFRNAIDGVIEAAQELSVYAQEKGLSFEVNVDKLKALGGDHAKHIETLKDGFGNRREKETVLALEDLRDKMVDTRDIFNLDASYLSTQERAFSLISGEVDHMVRYAESRQMMRGISDMEVHTPQLATNPKLAA